MQWRDIILTQNPRLRILRHIIFWGTWWIYLSSTKWYDQQSGAVSQYIPALGQYIFLKTFLLLIIQAIACYSFIYFLMPRYLLKSKWLKLSLGILLLCVFIITAGYVLFSKVFPLIDLFYNHTPTKTPEDLLWISISNGLLNTPKILAAATIIKLMQYWWQKQKEKELLEKESLATELQILKGQIRPVFLLNALNNIYVFSLAESPRAPEMLMKLSDLLSYMLYECDKAFVPVEKEINMMKEYMVLEKIRQNENIEMEISVKGDVSGNVIAPFLLLPFIENSFKQCNNMTEQSWINLEIGLDGNTFTMKLINGIDPDMKAQPQMDPNGFYNVQKRLSLLYPEKHELKVNTEQEMLVVLLKIQLGEFKIPAQGFDNIFENPKRTELQTNSYVQP
jgi:sensor histidine kinase YesM